MPAISVFKPFGPNLINARDVYAVANYLDGTLEVDAGLGEGSKWFPAGKLTDFTGFNHSRHADSDAAFIWTRQHNFHAAKTDYQNDNGVTEDGETIQDVVLRRPAVTTDWYLSQHEISPVNQDMVFTRLENPRAKQFIQAGYEYVHFINAKAKTGNIVGLTAGKNSNDAERSVTPDEAEKFPWGGFVHVGESSVSMRFVFDANDVAQEAIAFEIPYESLRHYLGDSAPTDPVEVMRLAAEKIAREQFPKNKQFKFGSPQVLVDKEQFPETGENPNSPLKINSRPDSTAEAVAEDINGLRGQIAESRMSNSDFFEAIGDDYAEGMAARAVLTASSAESQYLRSAQDLVKVDLRLPMGIDLAPSEETLYRLPENIRKRYKVKSSPYEGYSYRVTIERPRYREYGNNIVLRGGVRTLVESLFTDANQKKAADAAARALTLDDIFSARKD